MKKSKRIISLFLSVLMLMSAMQTGFVAFAADEANGATVLSSSEAASIPNAGAVATATQIVRVASGAYSYEVGTAIVAATPSGIPAMNGSYEENSLANAGNINEKAEYPEVKITFNDLPDSIPQIKCVNSNAATSNVLFSQPVFDETEKSYTWTVASGTANAGDVLQYKISYTYKGQQYVSTAYSFVENIIQPAGTYAQTTSTYKSGMFGWGDAYRARVNAISRVIGINTYGSLESFTTSSTDYRGYYNVSNDSFLMRSGNAYSTYAVVRGEETTDEDNYIQYFLNDRRSYADVYVDSSVTKSFADLNLRYAVTMSTTYEQPQNLEFVGVVKGNVDASGGYVGTGDYDLGTKSAVGSMTPKTQYVTTFDGQTFTDGQEYTIVTKITSSNDGAANTTAFPVGLRVHVTNKAALRSLIDNILHNKAPETPLATAANKGINPQSWYYSAGFDVYETAMLEAQRILNNPRSTQTEIDAAVTSLTNAYNDLVLKEADYSSVEKAIEAAQPYISDSDYTDESKKVLTDAISIYDASSNTGTIQYGYSVIYQPQVELWAENIYKAIEKLEYKLANYDELNAVYNEALELQTHKEDFFDFSAVESAMKAVDFNVKITEQEKVDEMTINLRTAIDNLKYKLADYSAVNEAVTRAQSYIASNYTEESFQALRTVLRNINYSLDKSEQSTVDGYVTQINEAIANLDELDANYTELEKLLTQVENLVEEYYVPETYQAAKQAATECEGYRDIKITQQAQIDEMTAKMQKAVDELVMYDADYSLVDEQIERYRKIDTTQMTEASKLAVENAMNNIVRDLKVDQQSTVNAYYNELKLAIDSLTYNPADYSRVELALERASTVDRTYWSQETIQALDNAIDAVVYGLGVNKQEDINKMADNINAAIDGLKPGPADYTKVHEAIAAFNEINQSHYTAESIARVQAAINAVNWNLTKDRQADVLTYAFNIQVALTDLYKPESEAKADYTELLNIVNTMPTSGDDYTAESYKDMNAVYQNINWNLKAKDQSVVVGYQNSLSEAIANLKYRTGDYSDVDAAIAEGRAIIERNDPPIAKESVEAFEAFVAGINRTYTIKQTSEIAALASQIRAEYSKFTYAESIHKAAIRLESDRSASYPGDIINVSVYIKTDYYAASSSIPVLYNSTIYELVGTSKEDVFQFEGSYAASSRQEGNINSPSKAYPSSYTEEEREQWKIALFSLAPVSEKNPNAQKLDPEQKVVTIQFKVRDDISVGTSNSLSGKIWIDKRFEKTEENRLGKLFIGRFETEMVNNDVVVMGQSIDLTEAEINVKVINPDSPANYTALKAALLKTPQYESSYYTDDTYSAYSSAKAVANEVMTHEGEYTVKDQVIVDNAAKNLTTAYNALKLKDADTSVLEEAVKLVPANPVDYYTEDSYKAFTDAVANGEAILAETGLTIVDNARINAAAQTITNAYNSLTFLPFAYVTEMENALKKIPPYDESFYTEETYTAYSTAYTALEKFKASEPTFLDNDEGMNLIYALEQAYAKLDLKGATIDELEKQINTPTEYDSSFYTEDTYQPYVDAIVAGEKLLEDDSLTIVDNERISTAAALIAEKREALAFKPFSYTTEVTNAVRNYRVTNASIYTEESYNEYLSHYNALMALYRDRTKDIRRDAEALELMEAVEVAFKNLKELPADTSLLDTALALETLDKNFYVEETYKAYQDALDAVKVYGDDYYWKLSEQETLNSLAQEIIDTHGALEILPFSKLEALNNAIAVAPEYPENYYETEAYAEYTSAKQAIEAMIEKADELDVRNDAEAVALIEDYNAKLEALKSAYVSADYTDVDNAIAEAGEYDRNAYKNFEIVDEAIANVDRTLNITQQETVNGYATAIREALGSLKLNDKIVLKDGATAYFEDGYIRGLSFLEPSTAISMIESQFTVYGDAEIVITPVEIDYGTFELTGYGTGTLVQFIYNGVVAEEYTIVVDGDINGDGIADAIDTTALITHINEFTEPELACQKVAVDLCKDGYLDAIDLTIVTTLANGYY